MAGCVHVCVYFEHAFEGYLQALVCAPTRRLVCKHGQNISVKYFNMAIACGHCCYTLLATENSDMYSFCMN